MSKSDLADALPDMTAHQLGRRVRELVESGSIEKVGSSTATRYQLPTPEPQQMEMGA